jgi:hypothetical protein
MMDKAGLRSMALLKESMQRWRLVPMSKVALERDTTCELTIGWPQRHVLRITVVANRGKVAANAAENLAYFDDTSTTARYLAQPTTVQVAYKQAAFAGSLPLVRYAHICMNRDHGSHVGTNLDLRWAHVAQTQR